MSLENSVKIVCIRNNTSVKEIAEDVGMSVNGLRKSLKDGKLAFDKIEIIAFNNSLRTSEFIALGEDK